MGVRKLKSRGRLPVYLPSRMGWACPGGHGDLEIHQPDWQQPDRLLGVCEECRAWVLIDLDDEGDAVKTELPRPTVRKLVD